MCVHINYNAPALVDQACECTCQCGSSEVGLPLCVRLKLTPYNAMQAAAH